MANRDTQFAGFAKAVIVRMLEQRNGWIDFNEYDTEDVAEYSAIVARAAYDLVEHTHSSILDLVGSWSDPISIMCEDDFVERIPDLPVLPEEDAE